MRVFNCVSYVHIDASARNKLDSKSRKYIFIGYGTDEFGYRFWDDQNRKIFRNKDVIFDEKVMYKNRFEVGHVNTKSDYVELEKVSESDVQYRKCSSTVRTEHTHY